MNPDVCGWLTLDYTKIDYPVVQGTDNFEYLEKDVLGNPSVAGSIFLDAKSDRNFHDFYTVIMGHHMQGRKMFGDIDLYTDVSFFEKNTTGTLYVEGRILKLETVAILKADAYDKYVYRTDWKEKEEKEDSPESAAKEQTAVSEEELDLEDDIENGYFHFLRPSEWPDRSLFRAGSCPDHPVCPERHLPFGEECFLRTDMYHQYAPFFSEFQYKLKQGGSLLYSWDIGME